MTSPISALSQAPQPAEQKPAESSGTDKLAQKETFLKLLVAQIRNQNPMNPADGIQFVTQLAQFSSLEQLMEIRAELAAIGGKLAPTDGGAPAEEAKTKEI